MQNGFSKSASPVFKLHYIAQSALPGFLSGEKNLLGVIGYGTPQSALSQFNCPSALAPLAPAIGEPAFEIWTAEAPTQPLQAGTVSGAFNEHLAFGVTILNQEAGMEAAAERAYLDIFDFLQASGNKVPIRFWNYPTAINADEDGMERYRRFNIGRHRAFSARLKQKLPPAASAVGGHTGDSILYFLAAPTPATPVENPRQISAFDYPQIYGPRSPSFSRASIYTQNNAACLFVSGTASIVGHESLHEGDLASQIAETAENLRAIIGAAERESNAPMQGEWALKIYLHDPESAPLVAPAIDEIFGAHAPRLYLRGDICRRELLVEIEAFRQF